MFLIYDSSFMAASWWYFVDGLPLILACFELMLLSLAGLLAVWGGLGRPHWFVRAMVVLSGLSLWLFVPAYEPMLVFFTQTAVAALLLAWAKRRRATKQRVAGSERSDAPECDDLGHRCALTQPPRRLQFSLRDMLLWTVVVALVSAAAAQVTVDVWHGCWRYMLHGTVYGLLTVLAAWVALGRSRWWLRAIGGCLAFPSAIMVGWTILGRWSGLFGGTPPTRLALRYAARIGVVAVSLLILLPSAVLHYTLVTPTPIPLVELPEPNGYDDLVRANESLAKVIEPERADGVDVLRAFVQKHASTLQIARTGLDRECQVPVRYNMEDFRSAGGHIGGECTINLRHALRVEAILAEEEGRTEDAIRSHYDFIRLGSAAARGGLPVDRVLGLAFKGTGIAGLNDLSDGLSTQQCRELIEVLEPPETSWGPIEDCRTRKRAWEDHVFGWPGRVWSMASRLLQMIHPRSEEEKSPYDFPNFEFRYEAQKRLLIGKLAIRCYRLDRADLPSTLADLVPEYLPAVPKDPFSGKALIYRRIEDAYVLYSVGKDGVDDGGKQAESEEESWFDKDLFLYTWPDDAADPTSGKPDG